MVRVTYQMPPRVYINVERREPFNKGAKIYDELRPDYPDVVIDWISRRTGVFRDQTLLEIGAGSCQATLIVVDGPETGNTLGLGQRLIAAKDETGRGLTKCRIS